MEKGDRYADRFTILNLAGSGGTATVYKAFDDESQRVVALKIFETSGVDADVVAELWNREITSLTKLKHQAVASYLDAGRDESGLRFIVVEWIDGESLEKFLDRIGRLTWDEFFERIGGKILPALVFAAERDIAHRDLSTSNILVSPNEDVKIIDFGQARVSKFAVGRTVAGWRTAPFCPPEEDTGTYTYTRDAYSFCAIAIRALAGYQIKDHDELYRAFADVALPEAVRSVLSRAMSRDPAVRYPNAIEFSAALETRTEGPEDDSPFVLPIRAVPAVLDRLSQADEDDDRPALERLLLELNDAIAVSPSTTDSQRTGNRLDVETQSCRLVVDIDITRADHLVIVHITPKRFRLDSLYQGERWTPNARFTSKIPFLDTDRAACREAIEKFYRGVEDFQASLMKLRRRASRGAITEWERLLEALRHIARNESPALRYTKLETEGRWLIATVESTEGAEEEQIRTISVEGGRWVFRGEIDLVRGNQVRLVSTRPRIDFESIPSRGVLELDWQQTKVALDRQARAVERFKSNELPNPRLGLILTGEGPGQQDPTYSLISSFFDATLDPPKKEIVSRCATGIDLLVTHGPPGTGKTKLIVELTLQLHKPPVQIC